MVISSAEFWDMVDDTRLQTEYNIDEKVQSIRSADPGKLRRIFLQYRHFTKYYGSDLGLLIFKLSLGRLKSLVAEITAEELGNGDPERAHTRLLDHFLLDIGVDENELENSITPENLALLEELRSLMLSQPPSYAIGLRGMGGECLCQIYLTAVYRQLVENPYIREHRHAIDWTFWDIHVGEVDIEHRRMVRAAIDEVIRADPASIEPLAAGYLKAKHTWDSFWTNSHVPARQPLRIRA